MKRTLYRWIQAGFLVIAAALIMSGCAGDDGATGPQGPQGTQGPEGPQGPAGADGAGIADCQQCHNDSTGTMVFAIRQWQHSAHSSDALVYETNRDPCNVCHTSEGFVAKAQGYATTPALNPTQIGCRTCHSPHSSESFALRTQAPVTLMDNTVFDKGEGNLCANCHHARRNVAQYVAGDSVNVNSTHWGPHGSVQADVYMGANGFLFGEASPANSIHRTLVADACVTCHMAAPIGTAIGGHSWNMGEGGESNVAGCNVTDCHNGDPLETFNRQAATDYDGDGTAEGVQDEFDGLVEQLKAALLARGVIDAEGEPVVGMRPQAEAGALWNLQLALSEGSRGVHNTKYVMGLLQKSIDHLAK